MKKLWTMVVLAGAIAVTAARANTVTLDAFSEIYPNLGGGEFTAYTTENFVSSGHYDSRATVSNHGSINGTSVGFETFCIETGVEFTPGATYNYTLGYESQPVPPTGLGSAVHLTQGAAWLYFQFAKGYLTDFNYTFGSGRKTDDNLMQAAIWWFQNKQTYGGYTIPTISNNKFYADAISALGANAGLDYNGPSVEILQLWNGTSAVQNQLVLTGDQGFSAVPDGGLTIALLGMATTGLGIFNRRIRK